MRTAVATLKSLSPLSWGRKYVVDRLDDENDSEFEKRTWMERFHYTQDGHVKIPAMAFKHCLASAAKYKNKKIPGQGKATFTKYFQAGIIVQEDLVLPYTREDVIGEWFFVPSDGKRGGGSRVDKCFPCIQEWEGDICFLVIEDKIDKPTLEEFLIAAGQIKGVGRFRPEREGIYGRFEVVKITWS